MIDYHSLQVNSFNSLNVICVMNKKNEAFTKMYDQGFDAMDYRSRLEKTSRFDKSNEISQSLISSIGNKRIADFTRKLKLLIISTTTCSDSHAIIPLIDALTRAIKPWEYRIVDKKEFDGETIQHFQIGSKRPVPIIVFANPKGQVIDMWIEKSLNAKKKIKEIKSLGDTEEGKLEKAIQELQLEHELPHAMAEILYIGEKAGFYR